MPEISPILRFHLHGDNIVECERTLHLIVAALRDIIVTASGPEGSPVCPTYTLTLRNQSLPCTFTFYPGYNRWDKNILSLVQQGGGTLREAADTLLTAVTNDGEKPLLAIEYCGALPAGNQAWQRNGRAYAFAKAGIPYVYLTEVGGIELDTNRNRKASRFPNPAAPFSYLSLSQTLGRPVLPVFVPGAGATQADIVYYHDAFGLDNLANLLRHLLLNERTDEDVEELKRKTLAMIQKIAAAKHGATSLTPQQWDEAYTALQQGNSLDEYVLANAPLAWSKTAYIATLTPTARQIMALGTTHAVGLTSSQLPLCVIAPKDRLQFAQSLQSIHATLPNAFMNWLSRATPLTICWVMGFKPKGENARPDRGLPPFARMLIGEKAELLTVVYGPAPTAHWSLLHNAPLQLMQQNGLWEAMLSASDAVLVDSATAGSLTTRAFLGSHWAKAMQTTVTPAFVVTPFPTRLGENDVDTAIHLLLSSFGGKHVFEGLCNPPGGDWSGMSLLTPNGGKELRWLTLPRVTASGSKRPDHVFQVFGLTAKPLLLIVESKERAADVERSIGARLIHYVTALMSYPASIQRENQNSAWDNQTALLDSADYEHASAAAFLLRNQAELKTTAAKAAVDLTLGFEFATDGNSCQLHCFASTPLGEIVLQWLLTLDTKAINVTISKHQ